MVSRPVSTTVHSPNDPQVQRPSRRDDYSSAAAYDASAAALWGEVYGPEQLATYARELATRHQRVPAARVRPSAWATLLRGRKLPLLRRLGETEQAISGV